MNTDTADQNSDVRGYNKMILFFAVESACIRVHPRNRSSFLADSGGGRSATTRA